MSDTKTENALCLENVRLFHDGSKLLDLNVTIQPGEVVTVMGASGSGKSSLLNLISGFLPPSFSYTGRVVLDGLDITHADPADRKVGLMFQDPLLFPHLSVEENLLFGLPAKGDKTERCEKVRAALGAVNMAELGHRDPLTLSGGQQSRIALIRVLLSEPKALLLDEPFSALDSGLRDKVREFVFAQAKIKNLPTLLVTHDQLDADKSGGQIITL
ncbi:ATP-binding cassette domain-containing protein [Maritalea porphyrae]|jgi:putative thiamine transport system ATP-binding protein|uniref:ATP-binding cassette domain-containing protein n=1 Tax=Maritalea porphyrae TaxID=880732 RepID=UPI0022AF99EA|nr:ATP-binding cassette domain-containing protein [Maritalea porphyrae]MCZ4271745.1 ATP-binding cassette domain-containing protein [Maritalea porphyrae]